MNDQTNCKIVSKKLISSCVKELCNHGSIFSLDMYLSKLPIFFFKGSLFASCDLICEETNVISFSARFSMESVIKLLLFYLQFKWILEIIHAIKFLQKLFVSRIIYLLLIYNAVKRNHISMRGKKIYLT